MLLGICQNFDRGFQPDCTFLMIAVFLHNKPCHSKRKLTSLYGCTKLQFTSFNFYVVTTKQNDVLLDFNITAKCELSQKIACFALCSKFHFVHVSTTTTLLVKILSTWEKSVIFATELSINNIVSTLKKYCTDLNNYLKCKCVMKRNEFH